MNEKLQAARGKLLKAAALANQAGQILIHEQGGNQAVHAATEALLRAAANLEQGGSIGGPSSEAAIREVRR